MTKDPKLLYTAFLNEEKTEADWGKVWKCQKDEKTNRH